MKNKIKQHIPDYITGLKPKIIEFENFNEIEKLPWVENFSKHPKFEKFKISEDLNLIARFNNNKEYIVGTFDNKDGLDILNENK